MHVRPAKSHPSANPSEISRCVEKFLRNSDVIAPADTYPINNLDIEIRLTDPSISDEFSPTCLSVLPVRRIQRVDDDSVSMLYVASVTVVAVASRRTGYRRPSMPGKHAISRSELEDPKPPIPSVMFTCPRTRPAGTQSASRGVEDGLNGPSYHCFRRQTRITSGPTEILRPPTLLNSRTPPRETKLSGKIWVLVYWRAITTW